MAIVPMDLMFCVEPAQPAAFCSKHFNVYTGDAAGEHRMKFAKGTTTLSFVFEGGTIVAVDSRSTQGPYVGECVLLRAWGGAAALQCAQLLGL